MSVQLSFEWLRAPPARLERLFFAVLPDDLTAAWVERCATRWRTSVQMAGKLTPAKRLHLSLYGLGEYETLPVVLVEQACRAADAVRGGPFDIAFDRCAGFGGGSIVLCAGDRLPGLLEFRRRLGLAMAQEPVLARFVRRRAYAPHVTMFYHRNMRPFEERAIASIGWTVREFVLVQSRVGRGRHIHLGRWRLTQRG